MNFHFGASIKDVHMPGGGGVCQKCTFLDKGEGGGFRIVYVHIFKVWQKCKSFLGGCTFVKNVQKIVYVFYGRP